MPNGATADGLATEQFRSDQLNGLPVTGLFEQVLCLGHKPAFQSFRLAFAGSLHGKPANRSQVINGSVPSIRSRVPSLGRRTGESNQDLSLQPIFCGPNPPLLELAASEPATSRHDADALHRSSEGQSDHSMSRLVIGRRGETQQCFSFDGQAHHRLLVGQ